MHISEMGKRKAARGSHIGSSAIAYMSIENSSVLSSETYMTLLYQPSEKGVVLLSLAVVEH